MGKKTRFPFPGEEEEKRINAGIRQDPDNPEWTDGDFARARPAKDILPQDVYEALSRRRRGQRGPQKAPVKKQVTLRLDDDVLKHFKSGGEGWQTRLNDALRRIVRSDDARV